MKIVSQGFAISLLGGNGSDTILGDAGADIIIVGGGANFLPSATGADKIIYNAASDSSKAAQTLFDTITDIEGNSVEQIDISAVTGGFDAFLGTGAFTNTVGDARITALTGSATFQVDVDGNVVATDVGDIQYLIWSKI